jgi:hypothetical protein
MNVIKKAILQQVEHYGDNPHRLSKKLGENHMSLVRWFKSENPSMRVTDKLLKYYDLSIVKIIVEAKNKNEPLK